MIPPTHTGGMVEPVLFFDYPGVPRLNPSTGAMAMIDNPFFVDGHHVHLPLPNPPGGAWPAQPIRIKLNNVWVMVGIQQSWARFDLNLNAGQVVHYRWSFYDCDQKSGQGTDFAMVRVAHHGGPYWDGVLAVTERMKSVGAIRTGDASGWTVSSFKATVTGPHAFVFICSSGGFVDSSTPAGRAALNTPGWQWPAQWYSFPSVLFVDGFHVQ